MAQTDEDFLDQLLNQHPELVDQILATQETEGRVDVAKQQGAQGAKQRNAALPEGRQVGRVYRAPSWMETASAGLDKYQGGQAQEQSYQDQLAAGATNTQGAKAGLLAAALRSRSGAATPTQPATTSAGGGGDSMGTPPGDLVASGEGTAGFQGAESDPWERLKKAYIQSKVQQNFPGIDTMDSEFQGA